MKATKSLILCLVLLCGAALLGAQTPEWQWAVGAGGPVTGSAKWDQGRSIAIDSQGNQYITGAFWGTSTFGGHTLTASGDEDIFVAKLDPSGNWLWAVKAGGTDWDEGWGIVVDGMDNACVTGYFEGTAMFGGHTLIASGHRNIFVAKLDTSGNWLWAVKANGTGSFDITLDGDGNTYITGVFWGTASFGNHTLVASGGFDIFAAKLDSSGNWLWAVKAGGTIEDNGDFGVGIALDGTGSAYVTGYFLGTANFGSHTLVASGGFDIFVAKLDPSGNWLWAVKAGGTESDCGYAIATDGAGNAWVTGSFQGTATFGSHTLTASGDELDNNIFAAKLDPSGNWLWAVKAGGTETDIGAKITVDEAGNSFVTGHFSGTAIFGGHALIAAGEREDIFIAKLDPSGNWIWAFKAGGISDDRGYGITLDRAGCGYVTGFFASTADFGSHTLTASGTGDIFVVKLKNVTPVEDNLAPQLVARLHNAYPNPLVRGGSALIKADIPERATGTLSIFNLRGQIVTRHKLGPGTRQISFSGEGRPAGVYLYSLQCGDYRETRKLVLIK